MPFHINNVEEPKSCAQHTGKMPKPTMGYHMVLSTTAGAHVVAAGGLKVGLAADDVKPNDSRVLGDTKMIGGGETVALELDVTKLQPGTEYTSLCFMLDHAFAMCGKFRLGS